MNMWEAEAKMSFQERRDFERLRPISYLRAPAARNRRYG